MWQLVSQLELNWMIIVPHKTWETLCQGDICVLDMKSSTLLNWTFPLPGIFNVEAQGCVTVVVYWYASSETYTGINRSPNTWHYHLILRVGGMNTIWNKGMCRSILLLQICSVHSIEKLFIDGNIGFWYTPTIVHVKFNLPIMICSYERKPENNFLCSFWGNFLKLKTIKPGDINNDFIRLISAWA